MRTLLCLAAIFLLSTLPVAAQTPSTAPPPEKTAPAAWATYLQPAAGIAVSSPVELSRNTAQVLPIPFSKGSVDVKFLLFFNFLPGTSDPPTMISVAVIEPVTGKALLNLTPKDREGILDGLPGGVAGSGGKVIRQEEYRFGDFSGRDFIVRSEVGGQVRRIYGRAILIGNRILALNVWGPENQVETPEIARFLDSFRLMTDGEKRLYGTTNAAEMIPVDAAGREIDPAKVKPSPTEAPASDVLVVRRSEGVLRGSAVKQAKPGYPKDALDARIEGDVVCEILIDTDGKVIEASIISGPKALQEAALAAVRQWVFRPVSLNGQPVRVSGGITFRFNLGK